MKGLIVVALLSLAGYQAYRHFSPQPVAIERQVSKTRALSLLHMVESQQFIYWLEHGRLATSVAELNDFAGGSEGKLAAIADARRKGTAYEGFRIAEAVPDGKATEYALLVLPDSGAAADGYAIVVDMSQLAMDKQGKPTGSAGMLYRVPAAQAPEPGRWPSKAVLASWEIIERLNPREAVAKAKGLAAAARR